MIKQICGQELHDMNAIKVTTLRDDIQALRARIRRELGVDAKVSISVYNATPETARKTAKAMEKVLQVSAQEFTGDKDFDWLTLESRDFRAVYTVFYNKVKAPTAVAAAE